MSNSNYVLGATGNLEKGTVLLIVKLQFSDLLQFGNFAIWSHFGEWNHNPNRRVLFLEKFQQTEIVDLQGLPEIWKSRETEILLLKQTSCFGTYLLYSRNLLTFSLCILWSKYRSRVLGIFEQSVAITNLIRQFFLQIDKLYLGC